MIGRWQGDGTRKILNFALDRIDEVIARPEIKYMPYKGDLNERFEEIIGVSFYEENPLQTIVFWVSDNSVDFIATKPMHESHTPISGDREEELRLQYPSLKGGHFFKMECRYNYELLRELTSFGEDLIVLSPEDIKQKVVDKIKGMCNKYDLLG